MYRFRSNIDESIAMLLRRCTSDKYIGGWRGIRRFIVVYLSAIGALQASTRYCYTPRQSARAIKRCPAEDAGEASMTSHRATQPTSRSSVLFPASAHPKETRCRHPSALEGRSISRSVLEVPSGSRHLNMHIPEAWPLPHRCPSKRVSF